MQIENGKLKIANWMSSARRAPKSGDGKRYALRIESRCVMAKGSRLGSRDVSLPAPNNFQFSVFNFQFSILFCALLFLLSASGRAQIVTDKIVASVTNGSRATPDIITYSDLIWQLTLEPGRPFTDKPNSPALNEALRRLEDQLLILQEARKLPSADTPEAIAQLDKDVQQMRDELVKAFGSRTVLEERMRRVGLTTEHLDAILRDRVAVEHYLDFRFRSFVLVSPKEVTDRYNQQYAALRNSGRIVPTLDQVRDRIESELREEKIESEIDNFVDTLREQQGTEIVVLNPV
jgi:hypothetical protein